MTLWGAQLAASVQTGGFRFCLVFQFWALGPRMPGQRPSPAEGCWTGLIWLAHPLCLSSNALCFVQQNITKLRLPRKWEVNAVTKRWLKLWHDVSHSLQMKQ